MVTKSDQELPVEDDLRSLQGIIQIMIEEDKGIFKPNSPVVAAVIAEQIVQEHLPSILESYAEQSFEKQLQLARIEAKIEQTNSLYTAHLKSYDNDECDIYKDAIAELLAQKAHLTTRGGSNE